MRLALKACIAAAIVLASTVITQSTWAFSLSPMSVSLSPSGKGNSTSFILDNNGPEKIAVQVSMAKREVSVDGTERNPDADDEFIVYPSQLVLEPNDKRTVRVTWAGDLKPMRELAYRIIAEQLPVDTTRPEKKERGLIKMLLRYLGSVYITPPGANAKIELDRIEPIASHDKKKTPHLALYLVNSGTAHAIIKRAKLKITRPGSAPLELGWDALKELDGQNVLASSKRRFELAWPPKLPHSITNLQAQLEIEAN